jgi:hypothetical protein
MIVPPSFHDQTLEALHAQIEFPVMNLPNTVEELGEVLRQAGDRPLDMNQLQACLRNVIAITPGIPRFLVRRFQNNAVMVTPMSEKQLYKLLKDFGIITYVEVKRTSIDKVLRPETFQATLNVFVKGEDGLYYLYDRHT